MPVGQFKTFAACVAHMQSKGHDAESAKKMCGKMENQKLSNEKLQWAVPIQEFALDEGTKDFKIRGIAINSTVTRNNVRYAKEELSKSATSLQNKPILKDHNNSVDAIVGRTTNNVMFNETINAVTFEGIIKDKTMQEMISDGRIQSVSVGAMVHELSQETTDGEESPYLTAKGIDFVELSLVAVPADPNAGFAKACLEKFDFSKKEIKEEVPMTDKTNEAVKPDPTEALTKMIESLSKQVESLTKKTEEKVVPVVEVPKAEPRSQVATPTITNNWDGYMVEVMGSTASICRERKVN